MDDDTAIKVEGVNKTFKLPHEKNTSIKSAVVNFYKRKKTFETQKVLKDISFEIKKGEFFGIVGRNGSGKSTLLKLLAGIYSPDSGNIEVNGKITPFIELGVGFNPELTGRENVFLNGALLGFNRKEMAAMYDDIVDFAEIKRFMDQKLKNYSSGMQVRLAFSIAIQAQSEILILDEVLAVGDEAFQKKCIGVFEKYKAKKQTIILVTHDMSTVEKYCDRALLIEAGSQIELGSPQKIAHQYSDMNFGRYVKSKKMSAPEGKIGNLNIDCAVLDSHGKAKLVFDYGEEISIQLGWKDNQPIKNVGIALLKQSGEYIFGANTILDSYKINGDSVKYKLRLNVAPGDYSFTVGLFGETEADALEFIDNGPKIVVRNSKDIQWGGLTMLAHDWHRVD